MKSTLTLALFFASFCLFSQIPTDNLEAHYPFNGNADDESTNSNDGIVSGTTLIPDRFGRIDSAYSFDGINDRIVVSNDSSIDFDSQTDDFSISMWVKSATPKTGSSPYRLIEKRHTGASVEGYPISISNSNTFGDYTTHFHVFDGSTVETYDCGDSFWDDQWHHLVWIVDNSTLEIRCYIDGVLQGGIPISISSSASNNGNLVFGNSYAFMRPYFGAMDDIRIYSDILTECEVYSLFLEDVSPDSTESYDICEGDDFTFPDGTTQTGITSNVTYISAIPSTITGCDSAFIETNLVVGSVDITVSQVDHVLSANFSSGWTYQWLNCDDDYSVITGSTNNIFIASENGNYAVVVDDGVCSDTSICYSVNGLDVFDYSVEKGIVLYPNPLRESATLYLNAKSLNRTVLIHDMLGKEVFREEKITDVSLEIQRNLFQKGVYVLSVLYDDHGKIVFKTKLTVE